MANEDLVEAWLIGEGAKAEAGDRRARAVHAADRKEEAVMVFGMIAIGNYAVFFAI